MSEQRATFSPKELERVVSYFDIGAVQYQHDLPRGSHESAKVILHTRAGRFLLKRRPRGRSDAYRVAFSHQLQTFLADMAFPVANIIGTRDNNSMLKRAGAIYELVEFIPGEGYNGTPEATAQGGRVLATLHRVVREFKSNYNIPAGGYFDSPRVRSLLERIGETLAESAGAPSARGKSSDVVALCRRLRGIYDDACDSAKQLGIGEWEHFIVHGDWHPGNLLFNKNDVIGVLDFDSARPAPQVTDLANGALQFSMITGDRNLDEWPAYVDTVRFERFVGAYDRLCPRAEEELQCVAPLMAAALIAEAAGPIAAVGQMASLDGLGFLRTVERKATWMLQHVWPLIKTLVQQGSAVTTSG